MAEERQTLSQSGGDAPDGTLLHSGEVICNGKEHKLHLTPRGLQLVESNDHSTAGAAATSMPVINVQWIDVLCACEVSKTKTAQPVSDGVFAIHYIDRKADNKLCCKSVTLDAKQESAQSWISQIMKKCKEGKPQRLLIVINPIGGKATAAQTFEKQVRHIFDLAGVEVIAKVTERAKHAVEIAKTFDISAVDGVIAMGGDGMYMEILHGLTVRKQEEEGININDPDAKLVPPTVRVGIIPAGTGNGVSNWLNGIIDIESAVLNIIRGEIGRVNILSIFEPGKLVQYAGMFMASGYFASIMQRTDELRWMKTARYPYAFLESLVKERKALEFNIEVLKYEADSETKMDDSGDSAGAAASGWTKVGTRQVTAAIVVMKVQEDEQKRMTYSHFHPCLDMFLLKKSSNWENIKYVFRLLNLKKSAFELDHVETISDVIGVRFEMVEQEQDEARSKQQEKLAELSKLLDIDGELIKISVPKFEVRLQPRFLAVYCAPALHDSDTKATT